MSDAEDISSVHSPEGRSHALWQRSLWLYILERNNIVAILRVSVTQRRLCQPRSELLLYKSLDER
jgi:hypothetical protein